MVKLMPFKDPEERKAWQRAYMRAYRKGECNTLPTEARKPRVRPVNPASVETQNSAPALPKAVYSTLPPLTNTHRFEIWAKTVKPVSPTLLSHARVCQKGRGGRIAYAEVKLESSVIEIYSHAAKIRPIGELEGLDLERVETLKIALKRACSLRGVELQPEDSWRVGEYSHSTMENPELNDALRGLAVQNVGDDNYAIIADDGSHPGKDETTGKENWTGTNLLYRVLFELPVENAKSMETLETRVEALQQGLADLRQIQAPLLSSLVRDRSDLIKMNSTVARKMDYLLKHPAALDKHQRRLA